MKKTFTLLAMMVCFATAFSQTRIGFKGGLTISNMTMTGSYMGESDSENGTSTAGFHFGLLSDIPVARGFHIRPELMLVSKGSDIAGYDDSGSYTKLKFRPYYLELPINFTYYTSFPRSNVNFYVGAGPYLAYGIGGKVTMMGQKADLFNKKLMKRFDAGISTTLGIELNNGLTFDLGTSLGLANAWGDMMDMAAGPVDMKLRNTAFRLSIGYLLKK